MKTIEEIKAARDDFQEQLNMLLAKFREENKGVRVSVILDADIVERLPNSYYSNVRLGEFTVKIVF